jgi:inhibitor of KinA sporulation pathway (predicted exonuclease)
MSDCVFPLVPGKPFQIRAVVIVYDLEFTAWDGSMAERWLRPGQFREVVQIGAVKLDMGTLEEIADFEILVKPRLNPLLSPYFETLTGIAHADVARRGVDLAEGYERFLAFTEQAQTCAFGRDDLVFAENFRLYGIRNSPPAPPYLNIAPWLRANGLNPRHAGDVAEAAGAPLAGHKHDALFDARSVALGIRTLVAMGACNPFAAAR